MLDPFVPLADYHFGCPASELPFNDSLGTRGAVVTFQSLFHEEHGLHNRSIEEDVAFISSLALGRCAHGACDCAVQPFLCTLDSNRPTPTASEILNSLKVKDFRSQHIPSLECTEIRFPGYNPYTENDEIHNDFPHQFIFPHDDTDADSGVHGQLLKYVVNHQLWYVLLHTERLDDFCDFVILFAVGRSPLAKRLVGVITFQACHNLCD